MADFTAMVENQRKYFESQATKSYEFRREQLKKLQGWMTENEQAILDALHEDLGKSDYEGYLTEVAMVKQELADALKHLRGWMKPKRARTAMGQLPGTCRVLSEPYGVVLIMSPWNYPFQLTLAPLVGALAAGNCAVREAVGLFARYLRPRSPHGGGAVPAGAGEGGGGRTDGKRRPAGGALRLHLLHRQPCGGPAGDGKGRPPPDPRQSGAGRQKPGHRGRRAPTSPSPPGGWLGASASTRARPA